jgi:hypothetical protein
MEYELTGNPSPIYDAKASKEINPLFDQAQVGSEVPTAFSHLDAFRDAESVIFESHTGYGDDVFTIVPFAHAMALLFRLRPDLAKPVYIYAYFPSFYAEFEHQCPYLHFMPVQHDYTSLHDRYPQTSNHNTLIFAAHPQHGEELLKYEKQIHEEGHAFIPVDLFKWTEKIPPWKQPNGHAIETATARMARGIEITLGMKIFDDPTSIEREVFPIPDRILQRGRYIAKRYGIAKGDRVFMLAQSGSVEAKQMSAEQIRTILTRLVLPAYLRNQHDEHKTHVLFLRDENKAAINKQLHPFISHLTTRTDIVKAISLSMEDAIALCTINNDYCDFFSVEGADTGILHYASLCNAIALPIYTIANSRLWVQNKPDTIAISSPDADLCAELESATHPLSWDLLKELPALTVQFVIVTLAAQGGTEEDFLHAIESLPKESQEMAQRALQLFLTTKRMALRDPKYAGMLVSSKGMRYFGNGGGLVRRWLTEVEKRTGINYQGITKRYDSVHVRRILLDLLRED